MKPEQTTRYSRFLSLVLRHQPQSAFISLDAHGWVDIQLLLAGCARAGKAMTREELDVVVATNSKKRFEFSEDGQRIRASQGHSVEVDLQYQPQVPPEILYHGTASQFLQAIKSSGLLKMQRHHVHLAGDTKMTMEVGARRGQPALLTIKAGEMHRRGHPFFLSTNGVWLVDHVPPEFILFP